MECRILPMALDGYGKPHIYAAVIVAVVSVEYPVPKRAASLMFITSLRAECLAIFLDKTATTAGQIMLLTLSRSVNRAIVVLN